jgi:hypothetical protein
MEINVTTPAVRRCQVENVFHSRHRPFSLARRKQVCLAKLDRLPVQQVLDIRNYTTREVVDNSDDRATRDQRIDQVRANE